MRVRNLLTTLAAAPLLAVLAAAPASAGTGPSEACSDSGGWQQITVLSSPVHVGGEVTEVPGGSHQMLWVCYSTNPLGTPGGLTGGVLLVDASTNTTNFPGGYVALLCFPDPGTGVGPVCALPSGFGVAPDDVSVTTPDSELCLYSASADCDRPVPAVRVEVGGSNLPTVGLLILGVPYKVDLPHECRAVLTTCP
jgi:hypothetical protein